MIFPKRLTELTTSNARWWRSEKDLVCLSINCFDWHNRCSWLLWTIIIRFHLLSSVVTPSLPRQSSLVIVCPNSVVSLPVSHHILTDFRKCPKWQKHDTWHNCLQLRPSLLPPSFFVLPERFFLGHTHKTQNKMQFPRPLVQVSQGRSWRWKQIVSQHVTRWKLRH